MERRICTSVEETRGTQGGWKNTHRPPLVPLSSLCVSFRAKERASVQRRVNIKTLSPLFLFYYYYYLPPSSFRLVLLLNDKRGPSTEHQRSSSCQMFPLFEYKKKKGLQQMNCCYKSTTQSLQPSTTGDQCTGSRCVPPPLLLSPLYLGVQYLPRALKKDIRTLISLEEREVSKLPWINTSAPRLLSDKHLLLTHLYTYIYVAFSLFYILCDEQLIVAVALQYPKRCTHTGLICSPLAIFIQNIKEEKKS